MATNFKDKLDGTIKAFDKTFSNYMMRAQVKEWYKDIEDMESRRNIVIERPKEETEQEEVPEVTDETKEDKKKPE